MTPFASALVGLGRIGQGYDYDWPDASRVLTHATAFASHSGFELVAGVDPSADARARFERKFGRPAYTSAADLAASHAVDVWSMAAPTGEHRRAVEEIIRHRPKAVLCEKPIATCVADARAILDLAQANGCAVQVNYMRRFEPGVLELRRRLCAGDYGSVTGGTVWYSGGILNNGSHFIDLLQFLLGPAAAVQVMAPGAAAGLDPEPDVRIRFGDAWMYLLAVPGTMAVAEMTLMASAGSIRYADSGAVIEVRRRQRDPLGSDAGVLAPSTRVDSDLQRSQWHVVEALYHHLVNGQPLNSDGATATATLAVVEEILEQIHGRPW